MCESLGCAQQTPYDREEAELAEFKAGVVESMKQYNAGAMKTFDNVEDLLDDLHASE
jgi:hypothetical protein